jgi:hypothetical protein
MFTTKIVRKLIKRSQRDSETVQVFFLPKVSEELMDKADDWSESESGLDFWGEDPNGEWHISLKFKKK